jgi:hypothetical protein
MLTLNPADGSLDGTPYPLRPEVGSDGSGIGATALSRLPIALLDLMSQRLALGGSGDGAKRTSGNG